MKTGVVERSPLVSAHQNRRLFRDNIIGLNVHCLKSAPAVLNRRASQAGNRNSPIALIWDVVGVGITVAHDPPSAADGGGRQALPAKLRREQRWPRPSRTLPQQFSMP